jgi:hypothetical protein
LLLIVCSKPVEKLKAITMMATLNVVAAIASLMIKRENVFCRLKAMRFAIKADIFNSVNFSGGNELLCNRFQN